MAGETTFGDLGLHFPLFEAPVSNASHYHGIATCSLCGTSGRHCFSCGISAYVDVVCPRCQSDNVCQGCDVAEGACATCGAAFKLALGPHDWPLACYDCLRAGRATLTKDSEFGMISRTEALSGRTHGVPGLATTMFETVPTGDEDWVAVLVPRDHLTELVRTPGYNTWQGECWLFCCRRPMIFCGEWKSADFDRHAPAGGALALAESMVTEDESGSWQGVFPDALSFYVFRCGTCGKSRAHTDID